MSEFKEGDEVLVHGVVIAIDNEEPSIRVEFPGYESAWVREAATVPAPVEPQSVDPSTLREGDRVRRMHTREGTVTHRIGNTIEVDGYLLAADLGTWFLLDRPQPVDPRREAVTRAVAELRARDVMLTDSDVVDRLLAAIDGAVQR